ncbi:MAG: hypothetical protein Q7V01_02435 [Vicinamibacterales bacterium]|nr:hypothetical protein [Vicinamibacterales bacterium]
MLRPTRDSGLWLATVALLCMGLAPALHAGAGTEKQAAHQAATPPAKPAAAKPAATNKASQGAAADTTHAAPAKPARPAQASAVDVVKRIQTVMAKEQAKPGGHAGGAATHAAPKAPRPKPAPLLRWVGMPRPGDVTLTWDPAIRPGGAATPGVRLTWPADGPDAVQK